MTNYYVDESVLQHYGVKGMKWGVKKAAINASQGFRNRMARNDQMFREKTNSMLTSNAKQKAKTNKLAEKRGVSTASAQTIRRNRWVAGQKAVGSLLIGASLNIMANQLRTNNLAVTAGMTKAARIVGVAAVANAGFQIGSAHNKNKRIRGKD